MVQAIALQTIKANPEDFAHRFSDRLRSLASTQDLLFANFRGNVSLPELVSSQLGHFSQATGNRLAIKGPYILLNSRAAQALGLALHELGTNAAKYGAFANDSGHIRLKWNVEPAKRRFTMSWVERGGTSSVVVMNNRTSSFTEGPSFSISPACRRHRHASLPIVTKSTPD